MTTNLSRIFVADDKFIDAIISLERSGWVRHPIVTFPFSTFLWRNYSKIKWESIRPSQYVNHIQNAIELSKKSQLCRNLKKISSSAFYPNTFILNDQKGWNMFVVEYVYIQAVILLKYISENLASDSIELPCTIDVVAVACRFLTKFAENTNLSHASFLEQIFNSSNREWMDLLNVSFELSTKTLVHIENERNSLIQFILSSLSRSNKQWSLGNSRNIWIVKPSGLSQGRGIVCKSKWRDLCEIYEQINKKKSEYVIQKYIESPFLIFGRKFDIRQWILLCGDCRQELSLWWYSKCYLRFSGMNYSTINLENRYIHLCNYSIQKDYDQETNKEFPERMWRSDEFENFLNNNGHDDIWNKKIIPKMQYAAKQSILAVKDQLKTRDRGFEWLGLDFILDDQLNPWLLEVNVSPDVSHSTKVTADLLPNATKDALSIVFNSKDNIQQVGQWLRLHIDE